MGLRGSVHLFWIERREERARRFREKGKARSTKAGQARFREGGQARSTEGGQARSTEGGQAIVEYIVLLALVIGMVAGIAVMFRNTIYKTWAKFGAEISAACPKCQPVDPGVARLMGQSQGN